MLDEVGQGEICGPHSSWTAGLAVSTPLCKEWASRGWCWPRTLSF